MKTATKCLVVSLFIMAVLGCPPTQAYTEWDSLSPENSTHQFLFDQIPIILASDGHAGVADFIDGRYLMRMKLGSIRADETLWDSREHYMDPQTHEGLVGFKSAGQLGTERFGAAVSYWSAGNKDDAFFNLGWAVHLVQDLTVPHHAALTPLDYHAEYEQWVFDHRHDFPADSDGVYDFDSYLPGHYESESDPFDWVDYNAHYAIQFFEDVNGENGQSGNDYGYAAANLLPRAQRTSAGFLIMFLDTVNTAPTADGGGDKVVKETELVSFDASGSADDMGIVNWTWDFGDGSLGYGRKVVHSYPLGSYLVFLTVRDVLGEETSDSLSVLVLDATAPIALAGDDRSVVAGEEFTLDASGSSDNVGIVNMMWTCDQTVIGYGETLDHTLDAPGSYRMSLIAEDSAGNYGVDDFIVFALDVNPPQAIVDEEVTLTTGQTWAFNASLCGDDFGIGNMTWFFGDGDLAWGGQVNHSYEYAGIYVVTLVVEDLSGNTDRARVVVTVVPPTDSSPDGDSSVAWLVLFGVLAIVIGLIVVILVRRILKAKKP